jgi:ubiquinone/menaquinone biosynthesis C-methylase UbiE
MSTTENPLAKASHTYQSRLSNGIRRVVFKRLPRSLRQRLKMLTQIPRDAVDLLLGRRKELIPPRYLNFAGDGDFEATGNEFLRYFIDLGGLRPEHRVLEVGCGIGRMARPLTKYLTIGSYEGIDIVPKGIRWCQQQISGRYPKFHFQLADIHSVMYNPQGRQQASQYRFPFGDNEFDFVFLTSVFTHMMKQDVEQYLREIARTLRPNGVCLSTFFLLNENTLKLMNAGLSSLRFRFLRAGCHIDDEHNPDNAVAFEEQCVHSMLQEVGLTAESVKYGAWPGRPRYLSYQDILIVRRFNAVPQIAK